MNGARRPPTPIRPHAAIGIGLVVGLAASTAWAATPEAGSAGPVLFGLAMLVVAAKAGGLLAERWGQASVLGELIVGIGLGNLLPPLFGDQGIRFVQQDPTLHVLAEVGVLILLFDVGLEADLLGPRASGPVVGAGGSARAHRALRPRVGGHRLAPS